jgi:hypothetical protein
VTSPFIVPGRDPLHKTGRAKTAATTYYTIPGANLISATTMVPGTDMHYAAWFSRTPIVIDRLAAEVTTAAGTNFRIGFYAANTNWQPVGAPLADSGNLSSASPGVKTYTPGTPIHVPPGRYVSVWLMENASTALRVFRSAFEPPLDTGLSANAFINGWTVGAIYGAFPTPGTAWDGVVTASGSPHAHAVVYRVSAP